MFLVLVCYVYIFFQKGTLRQHVILCISIITAEKHDKAELGRLLQLILGCAVNCDEKQGID